MRTTSPRQLLPKFHADQRSLRPISIMILAVILTACGGGSGEDGSTGGGNNSGGAGGGSTTRRDQPTNTEGRLLASNCFQCHGTGGTGGFESIRGSEAAEVSKYRNLASRPARADIMAAHAQGYTDAQIAAAIRYLQQ